VSAAPGPSAAGRAARPSLDGFVVVDKPEGWTSHDVVARARRLLAERRIGHAGTLDPDATGVLVLGVGRATRLMRFATSLAKSYVGEVVLGTATTTLDASGETTATFDMSGVELEDVRAAASTLTGRIAQVPPMVSAVQIGGRRLHELAREGIEVDRPARTVEVYRFDVEPTDEAGVFRVEVDCSSGTYVRVLAADLGAALGGAAHLRALRRTAVGPFHIGDAVPLDALDRADVGPARGLVAHLAQVTAGGELQAWVRHGKVLERRILGVSGDGPWAVLDEGGELLAVYEPREGDRAKPVVVLAPPAVAVAQAPGGPPGVGDAPRRRVASARVEQEQPTLGATSRVAVTVGSYDGVHLGHRRLLAEARRFADAAGLSLVAVTFDRHPAAILRPAHVPRLLTALDHKVELLRSAGVDDVVVLAFDEARAAESPEDFVTEVLLGELGARLVVAGANFRFGHGHRGDIELLRSMGESLGFEARGVDLMREGAGGETVSSSHIRRLVAEGALAEAAGLLGRPHEVRGAVRRPPGPGDLVLAVPAELLLPPAGEYAATVGPPGEDAAAVAATVVVPDSPPAAGTEVLLELRPASAGSGPSPDGAGAGRLAVRFLAGEAAGSPGRVDVGASVPGGGDR